MRTQQTAWILLTLLTTVPAFADKPNAVKALIITGDHAGDWKATSSALKETLSKAGHQVDVIEKPSADLTKENLAAYDVFILNYARTESGAKSNPDSVWSEQNQRALADAVSSGTGLVVLHHASGSFKDDSPWGREYGQMIAGGRRGRSKTDGSRDLEITIQQDHPVTCGIGSFKYPNGNLVHTPRITDGSQVLATAFDGREQDEPVVWVNHHGKGRVVHNLLGHSAEAMQSDGFGPLLVGCVEWAGEKGFRMIFNGKTLDGWEGNLRYWSVQNGTIVGTRPSWKSMPEHDFLMTVEDFDDFELRIEAKVIGQRNSGIVVRTVKQRYSYPIAGYEVDMGVFRWGWFYEEGGRRQILNRDVQKELQPKIRAVLKQGDFNKVIVRCIDNKLDAWLNGVPFSFVDNNQDVARRLRTGKIGLQLHDGKPQVVFFRNIRVKDLSNPQKK